MRYSNPMRFSAGALANAVAWGVVFGLIAGALLVVRDFGCPGLFILGALTWIVCLRAQLDQAVPTWSVHLFQARMQRPRSAEERAAEHAEQQAFLSPMRFYTRCAMFLTAVGAVGTAWQIWR